MRPTAPTRLSMTTDCFSCWLITSDIGRTRLSVAVPGANGTTMRTGLVGKDCASADDAANARNRASRFFFMSSSLIGYDNQAMKQKIIALEEHYWDPEVASHFKDKGPEMKVQALQERLHDLGALRLK